MLSNQGGLFAAPIAYGVANSPGNSALADLDADGDQDLAVVSTTTDTVSVLLNNGDGTFAPQTAYPTLAGPFGIGVGDLDGDGDQDLAVTNTGTTLPTGTCGAAADGTDVRVR